MEMKRLLHKTAQFSQLDQMTKMVSPDGEKRPAQRAARNKTTQDQHDSGSLIEASVNKPKMQIAHATRFCNNKEERSWAF